MLAQIIVWSSNKIWQSPICRVAFLLLLTTNLWCVADTNAQTKRKRRAKPVGIFPNPKTRSKTVGARIVRKPAPVKLSPAKPAPALTSPNTTAKQTEKFVPLNSESVRTIDSTVNRRSAAVAPTANQTAVSKRNEPNKEPLFQQVSAFIADLEKDGFAKKHDFVAEKIKDDKSWSNTFNVERNKNYVLLALCDVNCPTMNLRVYDNTGKMILNHRERQSRPTVYFVPLRTGLYRFKTTVVSCKKEPCRAALSVYER